MPSSPYKAAACSTTKQTTSSRSLHISTSSTSLHQRTPTRPPLDEPASSTSRRGMAPRPTVDLPLRFKSEHQQQQQHQSHAKLETSSSVSRSSSYVDARSEDKPYTYKREAKADEEDSSVDTKYTSSLDTTMSKPALKAFTPEPESPIAGPSRSRSASRSLDDEDDVDMDAPTLSASLSKPKRSGGRRRKEATPPPQFIDDLPRAEAEAMTTFEELPRNWYQNGKLGRSRGQEEGMVCECRYSFDRDAASAACGEDSGCINRLTQVECLASQCSCKEHCQNQRFQRAQYADIEIVQTEKKGFGLRAGSAYTADTFIYEYVGEVLDHKTFMKRMQAYAEEGIRHFYFMMLQREEYLDATKKGGRARFMNHSCSPNCFVAKWHVGKHMRMGIFASRDIAKGEELTFNYNVDRYGHDAQECFCGEPNCVGTLGGKTQTDIGGMDQLFIDALGITDEVNALEAKGTRKKKSRHLDEDFMPVLRPIEDHEVAKVITAVRQAMSNRLILEKLLQRIHMTNTVSVQKALVRLHGFVLMAGVIDEWRDDKVVLILVLGSLARWPLIARNKVVDAGVDQLVRDLTSNPDGEIAALAQDLLNAWEALEMSYRIARRDAADGDNPDAAAPAWLDAHRAREADEMTLDQARAPNSISESLSRIAVPLGLGKASLQRAPGTPDALRPPKAKRTPSAIVAAPTPPPAPPAPKTQSIEEIIRRANESQALQRKQAEEQARLEREEAKAKEKERRARKRGGKERGGSSGDKRRKGSSSGEARGASSASGSGASSLEKRLRKLVGELVVKCMSMHKDRLDREVFKKHARDLTDIICRKEMKTSAWPPKDGKLDALPSDKKKRMKPLAEEYIAKLVARKGKPISGASASGSNGASNGHGKNGSHLHSPDDGNLPLDEDDEDDDDAMSLSSSQSGPVEDTPRTASLDADMKFADGKFYDGDAPPPTESPPPPPPPELPVIYAGPPPTPSIVEPLTPLMSMSPPPPPMPMSMASPSPMPMAMAASPSPMLVAYPGPPPGAPPGPPPGPAAPAVPPFYSGPPPGY